MSKILDMKNITKIYEMGSEKVVALDNVSISINTGEFVTILGPSGSGKSTLMNIIGCLDTPTKGEYILSDKKVAGLNEKELANIRNKEIGFIFQSFQLLPKLTAAKNVELPLIYAGVNLNRRKEISREILSKVGLGDKANNLPTQLSGGQQQRVAIARAISTEPSILLADEPTGALDQETGIKILELFKELNKEGRTIIMITHDKSIAQYGDRILNIVDGKITESGEFYDKR
ncbi:ABC transporter ATP-binding protein [Tissierella creatinophila]|uniref:Macrolide export ATP-binding/permease protein MacB n=1 Tax=Tissierella creatinophila DSM 6911 TaxID=1123403 RepID=A0A1U7M906_TISCR|nr:ABC transporter ATP-binding protein [Tissierella creatinophila]OLS03813.1 macrolide export ATP-binding/permease protein MacB [Tissierella creatinophila DSM 6911]